MKCLNDCGKEANGRSKYCSKTCRALFSKRNKAQPISATQAQPVESATQAQRKRTELSADEVTARGNDSEFSVHGCDEPAEPAPTTQEPDAQDAPGSTKSEHSTVEQPGIIGVLNDQPDISQLPAGVSKPTGQRTTLTNDMTSQQLRTRMRYYKELDWLNSPEYAETIYRLQTLSIDQLNTQGQSIPVWRLHQDAAQAAPVDAGAKT